MNTVKVYSLENCSYCERAKGLLRSRGIEFEEVKVDRNNVAQIEELVRRSGIRTFPQIFIGDDLIGGYSDLEALDGKGDLLSRINGGARSGAGCCGCHH